MWRWKSKQRIVLLLDEQLVSLSLNHILHSRWQTVDELFVHRCQPVCQNCTDAMQYGRWWNLSRCQVQVQVQVQVQADRAIRHFCWQAPIWSQLSAASCRAAAVSLYLGQVCSSNKQLVKSLKCFSLSLKKDFDGNILFRLTHARCWHCSVLQKTDCSGSWKA